jgi:uncharacterized protein
MPERAYYLFSVIYIFAIIWHAKGANIEARDQDGRTALMNAVTEENIDSVELLLSKRENIEAKDNNGKTALFRAAMDDDFHGDLGAGNYVEVTKLLLSKGANVDAKDKNGRTALQMATRSYKVDVAKLLNAKSSN